MSKSTHRTPPHEGRSSRPADPPPLVGLSSTAALSTMPAPAVDLLKSRCRVLSYNLNILPFGVRLQRAHDYKDDRLADFVAQVGNGVQKHRDGPFDILLLQEVFSSPFVPRVAQSKLCRQQRLVAALEEVGFHHHAVPKQPSLAGMLSRLKGTDTGLVIASRFPITERASHVLRSAASGSPRGILFAKIDLPSGGSVLCFSLRLPPQASASDADEVRQFVAGIAYRHPSSPIVIGGHLGINAILQPAQRDAFGFIYDGSTRQSPEYEELLRQLDRQERLQDVVLDAFGQHIPSRPPDAAPMELERDIAGQQHAARTDFLLVSREVAPGRVFRAPPSEHTSPEVRAAKAPVQCKEVAVVRFTAADNRPFKYLSDHFGVACSIFVPLPANSSLRAGTPLLAKRPFDDPANSPNGGDAIADASPRRSGRSGSVSTWFRSGHTVHSYMVSVWEIATVAALYWWSAWLAAGLLALYGLIFFSQRLFPKTAPELPFGIVTEAVKNGKAPLQIPARLTARIISDYSRASASTSPATFAAAWRSTVRARAWLPCLGAIDDSKSPATVRWLTYDDVHTLVEQVAVGLSGLGLARGSRLGVLADSSADVMVVDLACLTLGIVTVPLAGDPATIRCQLQSGQCSVAVVTRHRLAQLLDTRATSLRAVILCDGSLLGASPLVGAADERVRRDAVDKGLRLLTMKQLTHPSSTPATPLATPAGSPGGFPNGGAGAKGTGVNGNDPATVLCDVGEETPTGQERQVLLRLVSQRQLMVMIAQVQACQVLQHPAEAPDDADVKSAAAASGSQHRLDRRSSKNTASRSIGSSFAASTSSSGVAAAEPLKDALFPGRGCLLTHDGFSSMLERVAGLSAVLSGMPVVAGSGGSSSGNATVFDDCRVVKPTVIIMHPTTLYNLRAGIDGRLARLPSWRSMLFRLAFATRLRLQGSSRDIWFMRAFFRATEGRFGGRLRTLVVPTAESLPFALRNFVSVCFTPRIEEVVFVPECGVLAVNGTPAPHTLLRIVDRQSESGTFGDAGELVVSGPGVLHDAKGSTGWAHTGVMARWIGSRLTAICPRDGLLWPMVGVSVAAPQLEREYHSQTRLFVNVFITCRPMRPLVAVVVPRRDAIEELSHARGQFGVGQLPWPEFVRVAKPIVLAEFNRIALECAMPFADIVRAVHLHPHPFAQHTSFFSQHMTLRRTRVARYFESAIDTLYSDLGKHHASTAEDGSHGNSGGGARGEQLSSRARSQLDLMAVTAAAGDRRNGGSSRRDRNGGAAPASSSRTFVLEPTAPFAVDIGGTCAKIAYFAPPGPEPTFPPYCEDDASPEDMRTLFCVQLGRFFNKDVVDKVTAAAKRRKEKQAAAAGHSPSSDEDDDDDAADPAKAPGALRFLRLPTNRVPEFITFMRDLRASRLYLRDCLGKIPATGGGAQKFAEAAQDTADGLELHAVKEMESIIRGMQMCIESAQDCIFAYDWRELQKVPHRLTVSPTHGIYPFLVVNIGSGVSIVKCFAPDVPYSRVGGTPIGGGTFWGLARAMAHVKSWDDVKELTRVDGPGDHTNVDLLVGDIYGFNAHELPQRLTVDTVASCFGKLGTTRDGEVLGDDEGGMSGQGSGRATPVLGTSPTPAGSGGNLPGMTSTGSAGGGDSPDDAGMGGRAAPRATRQAQPVDIVRSLLLMVATNVTQIAYLVSQQEQVENVFFTGGFVRENELVWRHISRMLDYWSAGRTTAHFIESDGFLGVLGALAASAKVVPVGPGRGESPEQTTPDPPMPPSAAPSPASTTPAGPTHMPSEATTPTAKLPAPAAPVRPVPKKAADKSRRPSVET